MYAMNTTLFWSRIPGNFVNKKTGESYEKLCERLLPAGGNQLKFDGSAREWYETLVETIIDCTNQMNPTGMKCERVELFMNKNVAVILEASVMFNPAIKSLRTRGRTLHGVIAERMNVYVKNTSSCDIVIEATYADTFKKKKMTGVVKVLDINLGF